jgi:alkylation response protein AidB-like acyl-CoA dehydrogenase
VEHGGGLSSFEQLLALVRSLARRDLTLAIGYGKTFLGAVSVWAGGDAKQSRNLAELILSCEAVSLGLTEEAHGADLLGTSVTAVACEGGFRLNGEKWLINNATRCSALTVLARTDDLAGPRSLSLFLVEKLKLDTTHFESLPKILTLGIRGADISGIRFKDAVIPADALVGQVGTGLEITLKGLQSSRTLCTALSLGAADTALRTVVRFSLERRLYGDSVFRIPHARGTLADAFIDLLTCECVSIAASRYLHVMTEQMSVYSAVVKYFVPTRIERTLQRLSVILGARHYLREGFEWGIFQKMMRDNALVGLFDGSSMVNLSTLSAQLRQLTTHRTRHKEVDGHVAERLRVVFDLSCPLPPFDAGRLVISNRGRDDVAEGLDLALQELRGVESDSTVESDVVSQLVSLTQAFIDARALYEQVIQASRKPANHADSRYFQHEEAYCTVHVATACLQIWLHNRLALGEFFARGHWLVLCLMRLLDTLGHTSGTMPPEYVEEAAEELVRLFNENQLFSILPVNLGAGAPC